MIRRFGGVRGIACEHLSPHRSLRLHDDLGQLRIQLEAANEQKMKRDHCWSRLGEAAG